jgi:hypothetical protein
MGEHTATPINGRSERAWIALLVLLTLYPFWQAWYAPPHLNDDAYITLTFAKSILAGKGFVYNQPPETLGTTSPLQTFLLVLVGGALRFVPLPTVAVWLSACWWAGIPWLLAGFRRALGLSLRDAFLLGITISASGSAYYMGMETWCFLFLLTLCACLGAARRHFAAGIASGLLFLCRGEGALIWPILGLYFAWPALRARRLPIDAWLHYGAGIAVFVVPWCIFAYLRFGAIFPNTLAAKIAQGKDGFELFQWGMLRRLNEWGSYFPGAPWLRWGLHALAVAGLITLARRRFPMAIVYVWVTAYFLAYSLLGVAFYPWYQIPVYLVWNLLIGFGIIWIFDACGRRFSPRFAAGAASLMAAAVLVILSVPWIRWTLTFPGDIRGVPYGLTAAWLNEHAKADATVGAFDIGYLGYYTEFRVFDVCGLVTPEVLDFKNLGAAALLRRYRPDYFLLVEDKYGEHALMYDRSFSKNYVHVQSFPITGPYGDCALYARRDLGHPEAE